MSTTFFQIRRTRPLASAAGKTLAAATAALALAGRGGGTNLLAEPLDIDLGQLFAGHQALDPAVEG